jgi:ubiquinone/menaquinone biosynthesis C-methylase UbiE
MASSSKPAWQLPPGTTRGLWDYVQAPHIAEDYDDYFAYNTLFDFDLSVLRRHFTRPGTLIDLGCGTGRLLLPFARQGFHCVGVDLSAHMLRVVERKATAAGASVDRLLANMTELDCLADGSADYAICMFSTLGMIRGRENRQRVLDHARRIVKPGGRFVLHVHNVWHYLVDRLARRWLCGHLWDVILRRRAELGDRFFDYRGVPNMFLHVFSRRELTGALKQAGLRIVELIHLDPQRRNALRRPWLLGSVRANGWIAVCE